MHLLFLNSKVRKSQVGSLCLEQNNQGKHLYKPVYQNLPRCLRGDQGPWITGTWHAYPHFSSEPTTQAVGRRVSGKIWSSEKERIIPLQDNISNQLACGCPGSSPVRMSSEFFFLEVAWNCRMPMTSLLKASRLSVARSGLYVWVYRGKLSKCPIIACKSPGRVFLL